LLRRLLSRSLLALILVALATGACASRSRSNPFVKKGPGFIDVGGTAGTLDPVKRQDVERATRDAVARRATEKRATPVSIEGRDRALGEALAAHGRVPSVATHLRVAEEYQRVGVQDLALDHYTDALRLEPRNIAALDGRARLWRDAGLVLPALSDAHRARYFDPKSGTVHNTLGTILERRGLCHEALAEYREALRLSPGAGWAQQNVTRLADSCK
jgi:tetratricopeptide (TPR) repeat protein